MTDNPKIIPPKDVVFDPTQIAADTPDADAVVQSSIVSPSWRRENMRYMAEKITPILSVIRTDPRSQGHTQDILFGAEKILLPYTIHTSHHSTNYKKLQVVKCESHAVKEYLLGQYGPVMEQSGIFTKTALAGPEASLFYLSTHITEFAHITQLRDKYIPVNSNPWLPLLALSREDREFFAGILRETDYPPYWRTDALYKPITLKDVIAYAEKVGEVERIHQYIANYNGVE